MNHHTPHAVLFGDNTYGGLSLPDLYTDQGFQQLRLLIGHLNLQDDIGKLILIAISWLQLITGSTTPFFSLPYKPFKKWIGKGWLQLIWQYTSKTNLTMEVKQHWTPTLYRNGDSPMMATAQQRGYSHHFFQQINKFCIYLQVIVIPDITSADGKTILPEAIRGHRPHRRSSLVWPNQSRPCQKSWLIWSKFLRHLHREGKLHNPLGQWLHQPHQKWEWFTTVSRSEVYKYNLDLDEWTKCKPITTRATRQPLCKIENVPR